MDRKERGAATGQPELGALERLTDVNVLLAHALRLHQGGSLGEAEQFYLRLLEIEPNHADAQHLLGLVAYQDGRLEIAASRIGQAIKLRPEFAVAWRSLGNVLKAQGELDDAMACYRKAIALKPEFAAALADLGECLGMRRHLDEAAALCRRALEVEPRNPETLARLGNILMELGTVDAAVVSYEKALAIEPNSPRVLDSLAKAYKAKGNVERAIASYRKLVELLPRDPASYCNLGSLLMEQGEFALAVTAFRQATRLEPPLAQAFGGLGVALLSLGQLPDAAAALNRAISLAPRDMMYRRHLAEIARYVDGPTQLPELERVARDGAALPIDDRIELQFALARAYHDAGRHADAFRQWLLGNALKRGQTPYDEPAMLRTMHQMRELFTSALIDRWKDTGDPSTAPVFIVGMPRSGTSLVEQVLGSHPDVTPLGEVKNMTQLIAGLPAALRLPANLPAIVSAMAGADYRRLGERYLAGIGQGGPATARVTDKLLGNFLWLGFIHLALPNARIIHVIRDPVDTCISCFTTLFNDGHEYANDLAELGRCYRGYRELMAHWRDVLPAATLLEVRYEDVVADLEGQARRLLHHCGLDWDARCLEFHRAQGPVRTASAAQVRQPIYAGSINRRQSYEPFIGPLLAALE